MTKPRLKPVLVTAASAALVTLAEAKTHLRVDHSDDDTYISGLITAAVSYLDGYSGRLGRAILEQTWRVDFGSFSDEMRLPVGNLMAVNSVTYYDDSNAQQTLPSTVYQSSVDGAGAFLSLKPGQMWPAAFARNDAVRVTWSAGYGATVASVPAAIKHATLLLIGNWYDNRSASSTNNHQEIPFAVNALLMPFSVQQI